MWQPLATICLSSLLAKFQEKNNNHPSPIIFFHQNLFPQNVSNEKNPSTLIRGLLSVLEDAKEKTQTPIARLRKCSLPEFINVNWIK